MNPNEIYTVRKERPHASNKDYQLNRGREPPTDEEFRTYFYACDEVCMKLRFDILRILHECRGRNPCRPSQILECFPKRMMKWEFGADKMNEEAWGLDATFQVAFLKVALYHLLILMWPLTFWGVWLKKWPRDWQNASVPFFAVMVMLSLFWLPFAHRAGSRGQRKHKIL